MKIIFLNCWYAKTGEVFFDFVKENSLITDIFCFQEVDPKLFSNLQELLPNHVGRYVTENKVEFLGYIYGEAVFVKKGLNIVSSGKVNLFRQVYNSIQEHSAVYCGDELNADMSSSFGGKPRSLERGGCHNDVGYMQYANIRMNGKMIYLANIHGKARPGHKLDTPARLRQSKLIINFLKNKPGLKIIGGDFNLLPDTKSVRMFEEAGYRNLIKEFGISTTRSKLVDHTKKDKHYFGKQFFADYVFISPEIEVNSFEVPNIEVSDHLPLILDFEV